MNSIVLFIKMLALTWSNHVLLSYSEAVQMLTDKKMLAPAYFIVGGTKSGEVFDKNNVVLYRSRNN